MFIVPDDILEKLICDICHKYLSPKVVSITNVHGVWKKVCGRCGSSYKRMYPTVVSYLYEFLSDNVLFKCINRFEGCHELLFSNEVHKHEAKCFSTSHTCYICKFNTTIKSALSEDNSKIAGYEIDYHVKKEHPQSFLPNSIIKKTLDELEKWNIFYYIMDDHIFFIFLKFKRRDQVFLLRVFYIGGGNRTKIVQMNGKIIIGSTAITHTLPFESKSCTKKIATIIKVGQLLVDNYKVVVEFDFSFSHCINRYTKMEQNEHVTIENYKKLRELYVTKISNNFPGVRSGLFHSSEICTSHIETALNDTKTKLIANISNGEKIEINLECILCHNISKDNIFLTDNGKLRNLLCKWCATIYKSPFVDVNKFYKINWCCLRFMCNWGCNNTADVNGLNLHELIECKNSPVQKCPIDTCFYSGNYGDIRNQLLTIHNRDSSSPFIFINEEHLTSMNLYKSKTFYVFIDQAYVHIRVLIENENCIVTKKFVIELILDDHYQNYKSVTAVVSNGKDYCYILNIFSAKSTFSINDLPIRVHIVPTPLILNF